jgi:hypothetical protein
MLAKPLSSSGILKIGLLATKGDADSEFLERKSMLYPDRIVFGTSAIYLKNIASIERVTNQGDARFRLVLHTGGTEIFRDTGGVHAKANGWVTALQDASRKLGLPVKTQVQQIEGTLSRSRIIWL